MHEERGTNRLTSGGAAVEIPTSFISWGFFSGGKQSLNILRYDYSYQPRDVVEIPVKAGQSSNIPLATGLGHQRVVEIQFPIGRSDQLHNLIVQARNVWQNPSDGLGRKVGQQAIQEAGQLHLAVPLL